MWNGICSWKGQNLWKRWLIFFTAILLRQNLQKWILVNGWSASPKAAYYCWQKVLVKGIREASKEAPTKSILAWKKAYLGGFWSFCFILWWHDNCWIATKLYIKLSCSTKMKLLFILVGESKDKGENKRYLNVDLVWQTQMFGKKKGLAALASRPRFVVAPS